jgi:hypothetical protein
VNQFRYLLRKLPTDAGELAQLAEKLGVSMFNTEVTKHEHTGTDTYEVQRRIRETIKDWRDGWLWLLALIAAAASLLSALAAWTAVVLRSPK